MNNRELELIGRNDTFSRSGVFNESDTVLVIEVDTPEHFKEGIIKLKEHMSHLLKVYHDSYEKYNELRETYDNAILSFTLGDEAKFKAFIEHIPRF